MPLSKYRNIKITSVGDGVPDVPKHTCDCPKFKIILMNNCPKPIQSPIPIAMRNYFEFVGDDAHIVPFMRMRQILGSLA